MIVTCARLPPSSKSKTRFRNLSSRPLCRQLAPPIPCSRNSIYISPSIRQRPLHPCSSLVNGYFPPRPLFIKARKERSVGEEIVKRVTIEDDPSFARRRKRRRSRCSGVDGHGSTVAARVRQAETDIAAQTSPAECLLPETRLWDFPDGIRSFRGIDATIERVFDVGTRVTYDSLVNLLLFRERERGYTPPDLVLPPSSHSAGRQVLKHVRHDRGRRGRRRRIVSTCSTFFFSPLFLLLFLIFETIPCNFV